MDNSFSSLYWLDFIIVNKSDTLDKFLKGRN
jgi:hypothetical protein